MMNLNEMLIKEQLRLEKIVKEAGTRLKNAPKERSGCPAAGKVYNIIAVCPEEGKTGNICQNPGKS